MTGAARKTDTRKTPYLRLTAEGIGWVTYAGKRGKTMKLHHLEYWTNGTNRVRKGRLAKHRVNFPNPMGEPE